MLSKKKDSGLNDGIAGKYVKRDTPPILRCKYTEILTTHIFFNSFLLIDVIRMGSSIVYTCIYF